MEYILCVNCFPLGLPMFVQCALCTKRIQYTRHTNTRTSTALFIQRIYSVHGYYTYIYLFFLLVRCLARSLSRCRHVLFPLLYLLLLSRNALPGAVPHLQMAYIFTPFLVHFWVLLLSPFCPMAFPFHLSHLFLLSFSILFFLLLFFSVIDVVLVIAHIFTSLAS